MLNKNFATLQIIQSVIKFLGGLYVFYYSILMNPFSTNVPSLYPLNTSESLRFSNLLKGVWKWNTSLWVNKKYRKALKRRRTHHKALKWRRTLTSNPLKLLIVHIWQYNEMNAKTTDYSVSNGKIKEESKYTLLFLVIFPNSFWKPQLSYGMKKT